jgi:AraC-like DNA-binding protein
MKASMLGQVLFWSLILHQIFVILLLLIRKEERKDHSLAIAGFFLSNILTSLPQIPEVLGWPMPFQGIEMLGTPFLFLLGPCIYLYCQALVTPQGIHFGRGLVAHLTPFVVGALATAELIILSDKAASNAGTSTAGPNNFFLNAVTGLYLFITVLFIATTSFYLLRCLRLLANYRRSQFDYFSSVEGRSLSWIEWMMGVMSIAWAVHLAILLDDLSLKSLTVSHNLSILIETSWVYALSFLVLWQKAVFQSPRISVASVVGEEETQSNGAKYQRSALDEERRLRIVSKIEMAMTRDKLYRNQNVTLRQLSDHTKVSENYLSQVLNESLERNFYEFINHWRIKEACQLLKDGQLSVIEISEEVGFNSRSTFNMAFKKETGGTPSEYRSNQTEGSPAG